MATFVEGFHDNVLVEKMRYNKLGNTGLEVSAIGFGGAPLGGVYENSSGDERGIAALHRALRSGINFIDTAPYYQRSEAVLGQALKGVPRDAYYIATKVGRFPKSAEEMFDFSADGVLRTVDESLKLLGLDYVDLIQVHDLEYAPDASVIVNETLPALERVKQEGKARFIGITSYSIPHLKNIVEKSSVKVDTVLTFCHLSLNDSTLLEHISYFTERNIGIISASPLSMSLLTDRGPPSWHPATPEDKAACRSAASHCRQHGRDISTLALKYSLSHRNVSMVLVGIDSEDQVINNLAALNQPQTSEEKTFTNDVIERFFLPLKEKGWGMSHVEMHKKALASARLDNEDQVINNLAALNQPQTSEEKTFTNDVIERFFSPLKEKGWGMSHVEMHKKALASARIDK